MGIQVLLNGQTIYLSHIRICQLDRNSGDGDRTHDISRSFHFSGGHKFQGRYDTKTSEKIKGNLWQAGTDPAYIWLGVDFLAHNQVLLNTIHIVKPNEATETKLDAGLVIKTYPQADAGSNR